MRLGRLSDLHLEHFPWGRELPPVACDAVVLAGDIHRRAQGLAWAAERFHGLTLWTDFALHAEVPDHDPVVAEPAALRSMPEFRIIEHPSRSGDRGVRRGGRL